MSADFRKVRPGQPLRITAKAWNRVLDSVATQPEFLGGGGAYGRTNHVVQIKNTTGSTVPKWGVLAITGIANDPTAGAASLVQFQEMPILEGSTPTTTTGGKFVVAVEPIAAGKFGRAAIDGVVQVKVEVDKDTDKFVTCKASASEMKTGARGEGLILWKEAGTGTNKWALVRIGSMPTIEQQVVTGVTLGSGGLVFTTETVYVIGKADPSPSQIIISTDDCSVE